MANGTYIAKGPHKRPCDLCGEPIIVGDAVETWAWPGENDPTEGNIMRVHVSCNVINARVGIEYWPLGKAFDEEPELKVEAKAALAAARGTS